MKTAISLPDELFERAEEMARRLGLNRSELYARALDVFIDAQGPDPVTESWNAAADDVNGEDFGAIGSAQARRLIELGQWEW